MPPIAAFGRIADLEAFSNLQIKIRIVTDFDAINRADTLKNILASLGVDPKIIEADAKVFRTTINDRAKKIEINEIKKEIEDF